MPFYNANNRVEKEIIPGATIQTFWGSNTLLSMVKIKPMIEVPLHTHPHEQSGIVLEGSLEMGIDGDVQILRPGDMYIIPGDVEHYAKGLEIGASVLDIFSPVREDYKY
ncbi:cupin domain-containing protein [SAR202 cluster bacterium AC-409-J13_OGT_754m]|nr:cupin domain-containing protein [SAR202 cluster bacterium AC-409-J13_OGT_754m]